MFWWPRGSGVDSRQERVNQMANCAVACFCELMPNMDMQQIKGGLFETSGVAASLGSVPCAGVAVS